MDHHLITERIEALFRQQSNYKCDDYLSPEFMRATKQDVENNNDDHDITIVDASSNAPNSNNSKMMTMMRMMNENWREKICEWEYRVIDHFDFNREVVAVSLSYLDRFLCTSRSVTKKGFQLAAITCLYMAIKLYEPAPLNIFSFIELSQDHFMVENMVAMEETILRELSWFVNTPTAWTFAKHLFMLLDLHNIDYSPHTRQNLGEITRLLCELSVCDYFFVTKKQSSIALAALHTAMDQIDILLLPSRTRVHSLETIHGLQVFDGSDNEVSECRTRLYEMYRCGCYGEDINNDGSYGKSDQSPVSIRVVRAQDQHNNISNCVTP